ncbi:MAG: SH3 domain-containing protein, partial [Roseburia sp.]|nr:SH3 domain-containing protein [Roseburia sp.]
MRRTSKVQWGWQIAFGMLTVLLVLTLSFLTDGLGMISHAQSMGKVTANSANIRKEANPDSEIVGSAAKDAEITINHQVTGTDSKVWYQIFVDANTLGYIRSDLVKITDGSTPSVQTGGEGAGAVTPEPSQPAPSAGNTEVTAVEPVEAKIKGSDSVRVRSDASTSGNNIVTTVNRGQTVTVKGTASDADGKLWYQVSFSADGSDVTGFIRSDYVELSGELTAPVPETPEEPEPDTQPEESEPEPQKPYETALMDDVWYLCDYDKQKKYNITEFISANEQYSTLYAEAQGKIKSQKTAIIILVILMVLMAGVLAFLAFKIKDMMDSAYFRQVEQETIRRRTADRPQKQGAQKVMQTVGGQPQQGRRPVQGGNRPAGSQPQSGQRPVQGGNRPTGSQPQSGQRPVQGGNRPAGSQPQSGQRPVQGGNRPAGSQPQSGQRPVQGGNRPAGSQP